MDIQVDSRCITLDSDGIVLLIFLFFVVCSHSWGVFRAFVSVAGRVVVVIQDVRPWSGGLD